MRARRASAQRLRLLYLPRNIADMQWRAHGSHRRRQQRVPSECCADIQAILDGVTPYSREVPVDDDGVEVAGSGDDEQKTETRWVYDDTVRGRRLLLKRDRAGRLIVVSYHPRRALLRQKKGRTT